MPIPTGPTPARSARTAKHEFLRALGADELVDHTTTDVAPAVRGVDS